MKNCRISIIVPCYNDEEFLRETLDCLQKQTIEDWECIIVNDGSTDNSIKILREYEAKDSRYKIMAIIKNLLGSRLRKGIYGRKNNSNFNYLE